MTAEAEMGSTAAGQGVQSTDGHYQKLERDKEEFYPKSQWKHGFADTVIPGLLPFRTAKESISVILSHRKCDSLLWQHEETNILSIISHSEGGSCSHASQPALESLPSVGFLFLFITIMCNCPEWLYSEQEKPLSKTCGTFQHIKDLSHPLS